MQTVQTSNTYNHYLEDVKAEHPEKAQNPIYQPNNLILINKVHVRDASNGKNAFTLFKYVDPEPFNGNELINNQNYFDEYDVAEILRGDYSKLYFDIDGDDYNDSIKAMGQVADMFNIIFKYVPTVKIYGLIESCYVDYVNKLNELYNGLFKIYHNNQHCAKPFSAHLFIVGVYFSRKELKELFKCVSGNKLKHSTFSQSLDFSVINTAGQKTFRHVLSGKALKGRKPNPNISQFDKIDIMNNFKCYSCTKTDLDTQLIAQGSPCYCELSTYISSKVIKEASAQKLNYYGIKSNNIKENFESLASSEVRSLKGHEYNDQSKWYFNLVKLIAREAKNLNDNDLFNKFNDEQYAYITHTHHRTVKNPAAVWSAIKYVRANPKASNYNKNDICHNDPCSREIDEFLKLCSEGVDIDELKLLIYETFVVFSRNDEAKSSINFIAYKQNNEIYKKDKEAFFKCYQNILIKIYLKMSGTSKKTGETCELLVSKSIKFIQLFSYFGNHLHQMYDFDIYSNASNVLSLYKNPITSTPCELDTHWTKIIELFATERDGDTFSINMDKFNYVLNWFAYVLQHPETKNSVFLMINSVQGIGKNILTNAICKFLGERFSMPNTNIDSVCGNFNGSLDFTKLIIINEVEKNNYSNKIKTLIDDKIEVRKKYENNYITDNRLSVCIFTNNYDVNLIQQTDRRFSFINSYGVPLSKDFYAEMFEPNTQNLKNDIYNNLINHLLSRDLTNYRPNECKEFDKSELFEKRNKSRNVVYQIIIEEMKKRNFKMLPIAELIKTLLELRNGIDDNEYKEELQTMTINNKTIKNIINFNPEDPYEYTKCKIRGSEYRDKYVIICKNMKQQQEQQAKPLECKDMSEDFKFII